MLKKREKMLQIRGFEEHGSVGPEEQGLNNYSMDNPRSSALRSGVSEIMDLCGAPSSVKPEMERVLSRIIKQEVEFALSGQRLLSSKKWDSDNQINLTGPRSLRLQFQNKLSLPVLTGVPIKGEECPLIVALVDGLSGEVIKFGPEASAIVEIVVLEADFGGHAGDSWTSEDFNNKIVEKEGNKRLLTGNGIVNLKEGIGSLCGISFAHTRIWMKKHKYRLGARIKEKYNGTSIREGMTEAFLVKDQRLDWNKKHYPPSLSDPVWRLKNIAKDGTFHRRLIGENIFTVKDFLTQLNINPQKLRDILGTGKMWEVTVGHARTCILGQGLHFYCSTVSHLKNGVLFNIVGQVTGLFSDSQYLSYDLLSQTKKVEAVNLVVSAFQEWENVVPFDDVATSFDESSGLSDIVGPPNSSITESSIGSKSLSDVVCPPKSSIAESSIGSKSLSDIVCPPKSSITESSIGIKISTSQITDELDFPTPCGTYQETMLSYDSLWDMDFCDGSSIGTKTSTFQTTGELDVPTPGGTYQETMLSYDSIWDINFCDGYNVQSDDHVVRKLKRPLSSSSQMTDSDNLDTDTMNWYFWEENDDLSRQFPVDIMPLMPSPKSLICGRDFATKSRDQVFSSHTPLLSRKLTSKRDKAQSRWRVLNSVMRWFSVWRMIRKQAASQDELSSIFFMCDMDSLDDDRFPSAGDTDLNQHNSLNFAGQFSGAAGSFCNNSIDRSWLPRTGIRASKNKGLKEVFENEEED